MSFPVDLPPAFLALALELGVNPEDIDEWFVRGGGHGGQKINKTSSLVHLRHRPTEIEVRCQPYREQSRNRLAAYKQLLLKIEEVVKGAQSKRAQTIFKIRKQKGRRSRKAKEKMLENKHQRASVKEQRRKAWGESLEK